MSKRLPFDLPQTRNGRDITKFIDSFELVFWAMGGEPKYYGYSHSDSHFLITKHTTTGEGAEMSEHLQYYWSDATMSADTLSEVWENRATLEYAEYDEVF